MAGGVGVVANVPRWLIASGIRDVVESARACYDRALADDATLTGRLDIVVRVRGEDVSVEAHPSGGVEGAPSLSCCIDHAHDMLSMGLPTGTRATARYSMTFGRPAGTRG